MNNLIEHKAKGVFDFPNCYHILTIVGGAGSVGTAFVKFCIDNKLFKKIYVIDNNDYNLWKLSKSFDNVECLLGDIRHISDEMIDIFSKSTHILHAAAYKNIEITENSVYETVENDYNGTVNLMNVLEKCFGGRFLFISSDKAVEPISTLGASKFLAENYVLNSKSRFWKAVVRFVNVKETRGNVFELWEEEKNTGIFTITDRRMKRWFVSIDNICNFLFKVFYLEEKDYKNIIIPQMGEQEKIIDVLKSIYGQNVKYNIIGRRKNEKFEDKLYTDYEFQEGKIQILNLE